MPVSTAIATAVISTGLLTWSGANESETVDVFQFEVVGQRATTVVLAWGNIDGQTLVPYFEIFDAAGEFYTSEGNSGCGFNWGGCSFGTEPFDPGVYTFYGYLRGLPGTTHNTYYWQLGEDIPGIAQLRMVSAIPEPSTYALMLFGLLAVGSVSRLSANVKVSLEKQ